MKVYNFFSLKKSGGNMVQKRNLDLDKVIAKATELIETRGLNETTMPNLAKALGVRSQSLYYYVKNRSQLLSLVAVSRIDKLYRELVDKVIGLSGKDALLKFADVVRDYLHKDKALETLLFHLNEFDEDSGVIQGVLKIIKFGEKLNLDDDYVVSQHALVGSVLGYVLLDHMTQNEETHDEADRNYHEMILRLVSPNQSCLES